MRGFPFIVIEGVDGVGKSSVAQLLAKRLRADYFSTPLANSRFAELRTHVDAGADPLTRYFYYLSCVAAAGVEVQHACRRNIVVCDRWVFSTIAYHCAMYEGLRTYSQNTSSLFLKPDYSVLLVASESVRTGRI